MIQIISIVLLLGALYFFYLQYKEDRYLDEFIRKNGFSTKVSWDSAIQVSKFLRGIFNTDHKLFQRLFMEKRPFLREDAKFLLEAREGLCGEGARVLVCILTRMGIDATRVTLFTRWLHPSHTVVSVLVSGDEYLIDTINSQPKSNDYLNSKKISTADFKVMGYIPNVDERRAIKKKMIEDAATSNIEQNAFFSKYWFYSYDALPVTKVLAALRIHWRVMIFRRPNKYLSYISERPNLIKGLLFGFGGSLGQLIAYITG